MDMRDFYYETDRLIIRSAVPGDADTLAKKRSCPFVTRYNLYRNCDGEQIKRELESYEHIVLVSKESGEVFGCVSVREDDFRYHMDSRLLHVWLSEDMARRGFMYEALKIIMAWLFYGEGIERISAQIMSGNTASVRLAEKLGFEQEGYLKRALKNHKGEIYDLILMSVDSESFMAANKNPF